LFPLHGFTPGSKLLKIVQSPWSWALGVSYLSFIKLY
jgi:hypothetical protein